MNTRGNAHNIYQLINSELERLHEHVQISYRTQRPQESRDPHFQRFHLDEPMDYLAKISHQRIIDIQNILLEALKKTDSVIQERVAELALTGSSNEDLFK